MEALSGQFQLSVADKFGLANSQDLYLAKQSGILGDIARATSP